MALNLGITQAAYTKLERNETKLTVDRLYKIAEILEVKIGGGCLISPVIAGLTRNPGTFETASSFFIRLCGI